MTSRCDTIPTSLPKLISELGVLTHPRVRENIIHVIGHAHTVSKDDDPRFYHEVLKAARRIKRGDPYPRYEIACPPAFL